MKAIRDILKSAVLFFIFAVIMNWVLGDPNGAKELSRIAVNAIVFGILMFPTYGWINRWYGKNESNTSEDSN